MQTLKKHTAVFFVFLFLFIFSFYIWSYRITLVGTQSTSMLLDLNTKLNILAHNQLQFFSITVDIYSMWVIYIVWKSGFSAVKRRNKFFLPMASEC